MWQKHYETVEWLTGVAACKQEARWALTTLRLDYAELNFLPIWSSNRNQKDRILKHILVNHNCKKNKKFSSLFSADGLIPS